MPTTPRAKKDEAGGEAPADAQAEAPAEAPAEDEEAAPSQVGEGDETAYTPERLIEDAEGFLGQPSYVVAGALSETKEEYLTIDEAKKAVDEFLTREVTSG